MMERCFSNHTKNLLGGIATVLWVAAWATPSSGSLGFEGLSSTTPTSQDSITLNWPPAQRNKASDDPVTYLIYQSTRSGAQDFDQPNYSTQDTSYRVTGLASNTTYYFVVRARDINGRVDPNRTERSAATFGRWVKKMPVASPPPRLAHGTDYDWNNRQMILFGGRTHNGEINDMWTYDIANNTWAPQVLSTSMVPSPRTLRNLAYIDGRVMVIGGITAVDPSVLKVTLEHDTWIYNMKNNSWTPTATLTDTSGYGFAPNFVYDSANKVVVLFGGRKGNADGHVTALGETWEFDVTRNIWTRILPTTSPSPRKHHAMVYDSANRKVILFGGEISTGKSNETWVYDAATDTWVQMQPTQNPSPLAYHDMVYDNQNRQVLLFGGILSSKSHDVTNETWIYNIAANTWNPVKLPNAPPPRFHHTMVYDSEGKKIIMFGGGTVACGQPHCFNTDGVVNETWVYE